MAKGLRESGNDVQTDIFFDTLKVSPRLDITEIKHRANEMKINFRYFQDESVGISLGETIERKDVRDILWVFGTPKVTLWAQSFTSLKADFLQDINGGFAFSRWLNGTFP